MNEEALTHWGLLRQKQTNKQTSVYFPIYVTVIVRNECRNV